MRRVNLGATCTRSSRSSFRYRVYFRSISSNSTPDSSCPASVMSSEKPDYPGDQHGRHDSSRPQFQPRHKQLEHLFGDRHGLYVCFRQQLQPTPQHLGHLFAAHAVQLTDSRSKGAGAFCL
eukprot:g32108.t1